MDKVTQKQTAQLRDDREQARSDHASGLDAKERDRKLLDILRGSDAAKAAVAEKRRRDFEQRNKLLAELNGLRSNADAQLAPLEREAVAAKDALEVAEEDFRKARERNAAALALLNGKQGGLEGRAELLRTKVARLADPRIWPTLAWVDDAIVRMHYAVKTWPAERKHWGMPPEKSIESNVEEVRAALDQTAALRGSVLGMLYGEHALDPLPALEKIRAEVIGIASRLDMDPLPHLPLDPLPI